MLLIFPKRYVLETSLPPKRVMRRLDGELVQYRPSMNILSASRFMKTHRNESLYYGRHSADRLELYCHRAKRHDGGATGFYARVEKISGGSKIIGVFRKPVYAYVFAAVWIALALLCALGAYAADEGFGAAAFLVVGAAGFVLTFRDSSKKMLVEYLEKFPKIKSENSGE